jgi:FMN reductase
MPDAPRLLALLGSVTAPGRMHRALGDAVDRANANSEVECTFLDLGTLSLGFADGTPIDELSDDSASLVEQVRAADGVILASPVYRASLTGALKNALDLLPVDTLQAKPVGILAMGGSHHHYLGVATHLRDILQWFGALPAPTDLYLTGADFSEGVPTPEAASEVDALLATVGALASRLAGAELGPLPLAARY